MNKRRPSYFDRVARSAEPVRAAALTPPKSLFPSTVAPEIAPPAESLAAAIPVRQTQPERAQEAAPPQPLVAQPTTLQQPTSDKLVPPQPTIRQSFPEPRPVPPSKKTQISAVESPLPPSQALMPEPPPRVTDRVSPTQSLEHHATPEPQTALPLEPSRTEVRFPTPEPQTALPLEPSRREVHFETHTIINEHTTHERIATEREVIHEILHPPLIRETAQQKQTTREVLLTPPAPAPRQVPPAPPPAPGTSVQIGSIDIELVAPPQAPARPSPRPKAKRTPPDSIARGYSSSFGFRQA